MAISPHRRSNQFVATEEDVFFLPWQDGRTGDSASRKLAEQSTAHPNVANGKPSITAPTHAVGIELGNGHSSISYLDEHGESVTIPNGDGKQSTPSVVFFDGNLAVVGTRASRMSASHPDKVVVHAQRYMGNPSHRWNINGNSYSPVDVSSLILKSMLDDAQQKIGTIEQAVISVPAGFSDVQRQATVEAGHRAGLKRVELVDEPVAAALSFVLGTEGIWLTELATAQTIMVVNMADDTFDVSIVRYQKNEVRVIASVRDPHLGELDWNKALEVSIAKQFQKEFGFDPTKDRQAAQTLALEAEQTKRSLSVRPKAALTCAAGGYLKTYQVELEQFERLTKDLVDRIESVTLGILEQSNSGWAKIDVLLTTGGVSRLPMVRDRLKRLSGRTTNTSLSSDQSISHGAAYYAGMLLSNSVFSKLASSQAQREPAPRSQPSSPVIEPKPTPPRTQSVVTHSSSSGAAGSRKKYLTLDEASALLGITCDGLIRLRETGSIRGFSDRGTWRFKASDVEDLRSTMWKESTAGTRGKIEEFVFPTASRIVPQSQRSVVDNSPPNRASQTSPTLRQARATLPGSRAVEAPSPIVQRQSVWDAIVQKHTTPDAWALVAIGELADCEGISKCGLLSRNECLALVSAADRMGYALEPDFRITDQHYWWEDVVSIFPGDEVMAGELCSYRAASTLLQLGITVALADGEVDAAEMDRLFSHLKSQFTLSEHDRQSKQAPIVEHPMSEPIQSARIVRTHWKGKRQIAWTVLFTDTRRSAVAMRLRISREELTFPDRPTELGLTTACIRRVSRAVGVYDPLKPKPIKADGEPQARSDNGLANLPADRVADDSVASLTANEQEELVTIRPAMPSQSSPALFPPKEPQKLGESSKPHRGSADGLIGSGRMTGANKSSTDRPTRALLGLKVVGSDSLMGRAVRLRLGSSEVVTERTIYSSDDATIIEQRVREQTVVISWRVELNGATETVLVSDLLRPSYPHESNILDIARMKCGIMTPHWAECFHRAKAEDAYFWDFWEICLEAFAILCGEWKAKRFARKRTGLTVRKVARLDQTLFDFSTVAGFAECAAQVSSEIPELGWSLETCCECLWKLLREEDYRQPRWSSPIVLDRAAKLLTDRRPPKKVAPPCAQRTRRTSVSEPHPIPSLKLDLNRINQIEVETAKVAEFLRDALHDDRGQDSPIVQNSPTATTLIPSVVAETAAENSTGSAVDTSSDGEASVSLAGLDPRFAPFVDRIARQPTWTRDEVDRMARELGLMLDGAIDTVNEWADEQFGDLLLIEEGDSFLVQGELLIDNTGPT